MGHRRLPLATDLDGVPRADTLINYGARGSNTIPHLPMRSPSKKANDKKRKRRSPNQPEELMSLKEFRKSKNKGSSFSSISSTMKEPSLPSSVTAEQIDQNTPPKDLFSSLVPSQRNENKNAVPPVSDLPDNIHPKFLL